MKCKTLLICLIALLFCSFFIIIHPVEAHQLTINSNVYFGFGNGHYINSASTETFDIIYRDSDNVWHFDNFAFIDPGGNKTYTSFRQENPTNPDFPSEPEPGNPPPVELPPITPPEEWVPSGDIIKILAPLYPYKDQIYMGIFAITITVGGALLYNKAGKKRGFKQLLGVSNPHRRRLPKRRVSTLKRRVPYKSKKRRTPTLKRNKDYYD